MATTKDELLEYLKEQLEEEQHAFASWDDEEEEKERTAQNVMKLRRFIKWVEPRKLVDI